MAPLDSPYLHGLGSWVMFIESGFDFDDSIINYRPVFHCSGQLNPEILLGRFSASAGCNPSLCLCGRRQL